jgi:hypothetical protein
MVSFLTVPSFSIHWAIMIEKGAGQECRMSAIRRRDCLNELLLFCGFDKIGTAADKKQEKGAEHEALYILRASEPEVALLCSPETIN